MDAPSLTTGCTNVSLCAGEGGDVEMGDIDGAYCELAHDIGGDPLVDETDAQGDELRNLLGLALRNCVEGKGDARSGERE
jgi:hypothetical protein